MSANPPRNFSWVEEGKLAAFGWPKYPEHMRYLLAMGIEHLITLSPETCPPIEEFPEFDWTEIMIEEFDPPTTVQIEDFINRCIKAFQQKKAVGVHCWMGRGRTGTMLACYFVHFHSMSAQDAVRLVRKLRPESIETFSQEQAVNDYAMFLSQKRH